MVQVKAGEESVTISNMMGAQDLVQGFPQVVADRIEDAIMTGQFKPGEHLSQDRLARAFGVSRIPMRDALTILDAKGLVALDYRRRAIVRTVTPELLRETYSIRMLLEPYAARLAIEQMSPPERESVLRSCDAMDAIADDPKRGRLARQAFYKLFYSCAGSELLVDMIMKLRRMVERYHVINLINPDIHGDLRKFISSGDARGVDRWVIDHLRAALQSQLSKFESNK